MSDSSSFASVSETLPIQNDDRGMSSSSKPLDINTVKLHDRDQVEDAYRKAQNLSKDENQRRKQRRKEEKIRETEKETEYIINQIDQLFLEDIVGSVIRQMIYYNRKKTKICWQQFPESYKRYSFYLRDRKTINLYLKKKMEEHFDEVFSCKIGSNCAELEHGEGIIYYEIKYISDNNCHKCTIL